MATPFEGDRPASKVVDGNHLGAHGEKSSAPFGGCLLGGPFERGGAAAAPASVSDSRRRRRQPTCKQPPSEGSTAGGPVRRAR